MTIANTDPDVKERLTSFVRRTANLMEGIEKVQREEIKPLREDIKEVLSEAKGNGFDAAIIRKAAKRLRYLANVDKDDHAEAVALWNLYWNSVKDTLGIIDDEGEVT